MSFNVLKGIYCHFCKQNGMLQKKGKKIEWEKHDIKQA